MDKEDYENELKQVLGDTHSAHDVGEDLVIVGRYCLFLSHILRYRILCYSLFYNLLLYLSIYLSIRNGVLIVTENLELHIENIVSFMSLMGRRYLL